ncbi:MAG: 50S ribosomal protein L3 [Candidatus Paceibacterota bacterium]
MKFILGKKVNMSQIFNAKGEVVPVTVIDAGPVVVTQVKDGGKDGYKAVQVGFGERKESNIAKAQKGHFKNLGNFAHTKEFRVKSGDITIKVGDKIDVGAFVAGDAVVVSSVSKGKGFQGVVKRHGFGGGPRSHGQKHSEREPGSISGGVRNGGRVPKNMRMAGRMGGDRMTTKNLKIVDVDTANNQILISGSIPGRRGTVVEVFGM